MGHTLRPLIPAKWHTYATPAYGPYILLSSFQAKVSLVQCINMTTNQHTHTQKREWRMAVEMRMAVETPHQRQLGQVLQCRETLSNYVWDPGFCGWSCKRVIWIGDNFEQRLSGKFIPQYGGQWNSNNGTGRLRLNHQRDSSIGVGQDPTGTWCDTCR